MGGHLLFRGPVRRNQLCKNWAGGNGTGSRLRNSSQGCGPRTRGWVALSWEQLSPTNSYRRVTKSKGDLTPLSAWSRMWVSILKRILPQRLLGTPKSLWRPEPLVFTSVSRVEPWLGSLTHGNEQKHMARRRPHSSKGTMLLAKPGKWPASPGTSQPKSWICPLKPAGAEWGSCNAPKQCPSMSASAVAKQDSRCGHLPWSESCNSQNSHPEDSYQQLGGHICGSLPTRPGHSRDWW